MPEISSEANTQGMDAMAEDTALITALAAYTGMAPSRMAAEIGAAATTLTRPASSKATTRIGRGTIDKLRARWPDFPGWGAEQPEPPENAKPFQMEGASEERMSRTMPVYGTALGADEIVDGEAVEQTTLNRGEVVAYLRRPPILDGRADVYGLYVQGSSMAPRGTETVPRSTSKAGGVPASVTTQLSICALLMTMRASGHRRS